MNIDFHYGVIYAVARLGGLDVAEARTVAHSCQYVDDAISFPSNYKQCMRHAIFPINHLTTHHHLNSDSLATTNLGDQYYLCRAPILCEPRIRVRASRLPDDSIAAW